QGKRRALVREAIETVLLTLVLFVAVRALALNFRIEGESMEPSLQDGEYLLVSKVVYFHVDRNALKGLVLGQHHDGQEFVYLFHPPERGEIVVFHPPGSPGQSYIKRVIAVAGETVALRDGAIVVNGHALDEPYIADPARYPS